ncbi:MAG: HEPN domain-containing protein [Niabella sp.]
MLRSKETMEEAGIMFTTGHYLTVLNRLYYAVFYIACAYLGKAEIESKTHGGTKGKFHEYFVKTGIVSNSFGKLYDKLFTERQDSDYGDFEVLEKEYVAELLNDTKQQLSVLWKNFKNEN